MKKLYFASEEELDDVLIKGQHLECGREGDCFLVQNEVWKKYYYPTALDKIETIYYLDSLEIPSFYFIKGFIYVGEKELKGTICDYATGADLLEIKLAQHKLTKIMMALNKLQKDIITLSMSGVLMHDIFLGNVIYDGRNFKFIDTATYAIDNDDYYANFLHNMNKVTNLIIDNLMKDKYLESLIKEYSAVKTITHPLILLESLKKELSLLCSKDIIRLSDADSQLQRILKK